MAKIVFVSCNPRLRKDVQNFYSGKGHSVLIAHDCRTGLELALASCPDIAIIPKFGGEGMDGYEMAKAIRADKNVGEAYLIALGRFPTEEKQIFDDSVSSFYVKYGYQLEEAVNRGIKRINR